MIRKPLWGDHPHFRQYGLSEAFRRLLDQAGDALDLIETDIGADRIYIRGLREPDMTRPAEIPDDMVWLPNIERRSSIGKWTDYDDGSMKEALDEFLEKAVPFRLLGDKWPCGAPTLTLARDGCSIRGSLPDGCLSIYSEGRDKPLAPHVSYWINDASFFVRAEPSSYTDVILAGGYEAYFAARLYDNPMIKNWDGRWIRPSQLANSRPFKITFPLDSFVTERG